MCLCVYVYLLYFYKILFNFYLFIDFYKNKIEIYKLNIKNKYYN